MTVALVAFLAMFLGDVCQAVYVIVVARRPVLAGAFDGFDDVGALFSVGVGGGACVRHQLPHDDLRIVLGPEQALVIAAVWVASVLGAGVGQHLSARFTPPILKEPTP